MRDAKGRSEVCEQIWEGRGADVRGDGADLRGRGADVRGVRGRSEEIGEM